MRWVRRWSSSAASFWDCSAEVKLPRRSSAAAMSVFEAGDLVFGVVEAVFELFELDGVEALDGGMGAGSGGGEGLASLDNPRFRDDVKDGPPVVLLVAGLSLAEGVCNLFGYFFGAALFAPEVVFVVAGVDVDAAVFDLEDAGGEAVDEVAVVGDEEDGAGEVADGVEQDIFGAEVEVVGGLVEQEEVDGRDEHLGHGVAVAFAAGEDAELFEDVVAGEHEAAEEASGVRRRGLWGRRRRCRRACRRWGRGLCTGPARRSRRGRCGPSLMVPAVGCFLAAEQADEGGFACAVGADEGDAVAALDGEVEVVEDVLLAAGRAWGRPW